MAIYEHIREFAGMPVIEWASPEDSHAPANVLYRLGLSYEEADAGKTWTEKFDAFLASADGSKVAGLVIGPWDPDFGGHDSSLVADALIAARDRLSNLRALFLGDIIVEESEISWIQQSNLTPLLHAYPALEHFCVRGGDGLRLPDLEHARLRTFVAQSGGLNPLTVHQILKAKLPKLEHLELWLGTPNYGGDATVDDLKPLLDGDLFPELYYLGLRDSEIADDIAIALANAPVLRRITELDLSMGALSDAGAEALLASPLIHNLERLDLHYHFCSEDVMDRLRRLDMEVDVSDPQEEESYGGQTWRYVAVSE
ncbi:MAG: STM4015 family protein [Anaerolineae bacterium]|nr:STM4015 family protein [Anaerolineae bacterium]